VKRPLVMIHASPASSQGLITLIEAMAADRRVIAPDTMGNGDSTGAIPEGADIGFIATACLAALDALGVENFDLYGTHTGGCLATEIAVCAPGRVGRLILDGMGLYDAATTAEFLRDYAPAMVPDQQGLHATWAWHFVRDTYMFWPWYRLDAAHRRAIGLPPARVLHEKYVEVLKAIETYHHSYRAAFRYDRRARLPTIRVPTLVACARSDMLFRWHDAIAALIPDARQLATDGIAEPEDLARTASQFGAFLDG
jgi:pimeloyl-ACP methyl ester carboxylesterase